MLGDYLKSKLLINNPEPLQVIRIFDGGFLNMISNLHEPL